MMTTTPDQGLTQRLANAVLTIDVPALLHEGTVKNALADTLAVAAAASRSQDIQALRSVTLPESAKLDTGWIGAGPWGQPTAAFLNGTAAHFLDFDDVSPTMPLHPSAVLVPALLAAGALKPLPFNRFAESFNIGQAMFRSIAQALPSDIHYGRGWHSTSTVGRLAAVAALARLEGLDLHTTRTALGMASTMASGSRANFGTMAKPMHAGLAAEDALLAVRWAKAGITASVTELEAPSGYFARLGDAAGPSVAAFTEDVEDRFKYWLHDWAFDWGLKRFPSCYGTHRAIDGVLDLRQDIEGTVAVSEIRGIDVVVHEHGTAPLLPGTPATGLEAKFSLEYCVALALIKGSVELDDFTDESFTANTAVRELSRKVSLREEGNCREFASVTLRMSRGTQLEATVLAAKGDSSNPLSAADLKAKTASSFAYAGLDVSHAAQLSENIDRLTGETDVMGVLAGWSGGAG